ncbi:MAG: ABC transporter permease [Saprospiraceae bacterium]|jgi:phospholipid/cholesterol/gamma-HCH transport system permease protein|nr:ABC transporter permease [Saprospiraceae bacterium]MBK6480346.1 ABC transporter permease [Saprospiraceae bacterium]MBK6814798.1 ABC transporter permease [Saprospiraceae bacterium]MBK7371836.1 ABC transporter permease [Saprospiraceae bacterium]MBK7435696.1 ABC transporter permease [Saprospiraceae bacterium]
MKLLDDLGQYLLLIKHALVKPPNWRMYGRELIRQMYDIGNGSLLIIALIAIFIGAVTAVQFLYQLDGTLIPTWYIGYIVRDSTIIELAPTISCLVLAGKVGSNMASEIGGMRQKEHIDAMEVMGVNTPSYLILPKILASVMVIPLLVIVAAFVSIIGGYLASVGGGYMNTEEYTRGLRAFFISNNLWMMLFKSVVFAFILTSVSCYQGYFVKGGSVELGKASTNAVVVSNILILVSDYIIALMFTT